MFDKLFLYTVILGVTLIVTSNATKLNSDETEARKFLSETSDKIFKFYDKLRDDHFNDPDYTNQTQNILSEASFLVDVVRQAKEFDYTNFKDKELKYAFEQITLFADEYIIGGERCLEIFNTLIELTELEGNKYYDCFDKECGDDGITGYEIKKLIETSTNSEELEFYWNQLTMARAKWAEKYLGLTLNGLKDAAKLTDNMSPVDFWLREYNITEMESLMNEIHPLYMELHAFIRNGLQKKYGDSIIKSDGLIPHHLFEQVLAQAWKSGSIIEDDFPYKNLSQVESILKNKFKTIEFYEMADRFYRSLGFKEFPQEVWLDHIKLKNSSDEYVCTNNIYYGSPNVHLEFCEITNFEHFLLVYPEMGNLYYAKEMTGLPAYYFGSHDLEYAIGKAAVLSASTLKNLKAIGVIIDLKHTEDVEMNRLLRKTIKRLLNLQINFVHAKLMADVLSGNVELKEINTKYWELMDKYLGVKPPMNYAPKPDVPDMPLTFYNDISENAQSRNFDSEILSYQMYKKFCEVGGKYPKEPLHLCDFQGTTAAGDLLRNMMRLGTSKPYNEVLATMFPENPRISCDGILEYFSPIKKILVEKNSNANVKSGWKSSR